MYGRKIKTIRELRGFSQEAMAHKLGMAQNSYSRIETNQTKLNVEMLEKIASELGVSVADIISSEPAVVNFAPNQGTQAGIQNIEHFHSIHMDLIDKMAAAKEAEIEKLANVFQQVISSKDAEIQRMQNIIDRLLGER